MTDLEKKSKKELLNIIDQLRAKLGEMQVVEAKQDALEQSLNGVGFSVVQDRDGVFNIVQLSFDFDSGAAKLSKVVPVETRGYEYALYEAKKFLIERIMNKNNLNHLEEVSNG